MQILITAGGTSEYIDSVRKITNMSTGRLATYIYKHILSKKNEDIYVHYVVSEDGLLPENIDLDRTTIYPIKDTKSLEMTVRHIANEQKMDLIIHSMAVSDFYVANVTPIESMIEKGKREFEQILFDALKKNNNTTIDNKGNINKRFIKKGLINKEFIDDGFISAEFEKLMRGLLESDRLESQSKFSSKEDLILSLKRTPKVIKLLRELNPDSKMVGFKLLNQVSEEELVKVASNLGRLNECEFVVANDLDHIHGDEHKAIFVKNEGIVSRFNSKNDIGKGIADYFFD